MKVLIVFNHPAPYKVNLFNGLARHFDLEVIFERSKASDRPDAFYAGNRFEFKHSFIDKCNFGAENSFSSKLKKIIKKRHQEFDLIIMNGYSQISELKAIKYMRKHNIPFSLMINGGIIKKESSFKRKFKKKYISTAKNYLSPCEEADEYLMHYGADKKDIFHYVYSTIYEQEILKSPLSQNEKDAIRKEYGLPNGKLFISASQFIKRKNNVQLIKCFKDIDGTLLLIGSGSEEKEYKKIVDEMGLNNVIIHPFVEKKELLKIMSSADAFITLSLEDIYGHTINEAMSMGLPVLSSDRIIGSRHLIKPGVNGLIVDLSNDKEIINGINSITKCSSLEALKTARENTVEKMIDSTIKSIEDLAK